MNYYDVINDSVEFIEQNINRSISLDELAERAFISKYHFLRIFKALTNKTPKDYIDERKLSEAAKKLGTSRCNVIDIALEYGFESHEAFTRRFKSLFGITPTQVKRGITNVAGVERIQIVERDFINNHNRLIPSFTIQYLDKEIVLIGKRIFFDPYDAIQLQNVSQFVSGFVQGFSGRPLNHLYNVVLNGSSKETIDYFSGVKPDNEEDLKLENISIPASEYAVFTYKGEMRDLFDLIFADVCKALLYTGKQLNKTTVESFEFYEKDYFKTRKFNVYIPVK